MEAEALLAILVAMMRAGTPLVLAATGELVTERSGVLNLGLEGMMLIGAVVAFIAAHHTGSLPVGVLAGALAGTGTALAFGVVAITLMANQVACGLALSILGVGLSAFVGQAYVGIPLPRPGPLFPEALRTIPGLGPLLFGHDPLVYLSLVLVAATAWFLARTRAGLILRAVGENQSSAHALGYRVTRIRYAATAFGGAMSGTAGAYLSLVYTPTWAENMTAGRGWIALALVVFATWRPWRVLLGAYLFGGVTIAGLHIQAAGVAVSAQLVSMLPYLATILVLVLISRDPTRIRLHTPACLGRPFHPGG